MLGLLMIRMITRLLCCAQTSLVQGPPLIGTKLSSFLVVFGGADLLATVNLMCKYWVNLDLHSCDLIYVGQCYNQS